MMVPDLRGIGPESRFTNPTKTCPHPDRWASTDQDSTEIEVSMLVGGFIRALQPDLVIETGTAYGQTSYEIGSALQRNGQGQLVTYEPNSDRVAEARDLCKFMPVTVVECESLDETRGIPAINEPVQFAWLDSLLGIRPLELKAIHPLLSPGAIVGVHDCGDKFSGFHGQMMAAARSLEMKAITLPTPRGVTFLQKAQ